VSVVVEREVQIRRGRRSRKRITPGKPREPETRQRVPRIAYLMALAIKMERMLARGEVKTQTELARIMGVTPARVTQIMKLLDLAPDIQEHLLTRPCAMGPVTESQAVAAASVANWRQQRERRLNSPASSPSSPVVSRSRHRASRTD
jgi:hypothetical protein